MSSSVRSSDEEFVVRVKLPSPLCAPLAVTAVVYRMPGNGVAWPQRLTERKQFTLDAAGVTEVVFDRPCEPVQFDVVTGATPKTIAPLGPHHGPLLFPLDLSTSEQSWQGGPECSTPDPVVPETPFVAVMVPLGLAAAAGAVVWRRRGRPRG